MLHGRAVAKGYDRQARLLADGTATYDEYLEAAQNFVDCAGRKGFAWKVVRSRDMQGASVIIDPVEAPDGDGKRFNRVVEICQEQEEILVFEAWQLGRPAISDEAYDLWQTCLARAGYDDEVPRSVERIVRELDPELVSTCERSVYQELAESSGP